jgi:hypothetical protein
MPQQLVKTLASKGPKDTSTKWWRQLLSTSVTFFIYAFNIQYTDVSLLFNIFRVAAVKINEEYVSSSDIYVWLLIYKFENLVKKISSKVLFWIRIRIGSGFNDLVDPVPYPDWAKMLSLLPQSTKILKIYECRARRGSDSTFFANCKTVQQLYTTNARYTNAIQETDSYWPINIMLKIHRPISTLQAGDILTTFHPPPLTFVDLNFLRFLF